VIEEATPGVEMLLLVIRVFAGFAEVERFTSLLETGHSLTMPVETLGLILAVVVHRRTSRISNGKSSVHQAPIDFDFLSERSPRMRSNVRSQPWIMYSKLPC
jgi:hypothetical protein